jgi:ubiquinone/menaquinone biosynthesis C-methylase UbiE
MGTALQHSSFHDAALGRFMIDLLIVDANDTLLMRFAMRYNTFDETAIEYDAVVTPNRKLQARALVDELALSGNEHVLEIGCGSGLLSHELMQKLSDGGFFTAIDLSPNMLALCRKKLTAAGFSDFDLRQGNGLSLPFPDNSFDVIVSSNVIPWVDDQDRFVSEAKRVLRPDGCLGLIALHPEVYREIFAAIDDIRTVHPECFNGSNIHQDIGVKLEDIGDHRRRLIAAGFNVVKGFVVSTVEGTTADAYIRRFNAVTGETHLKSVPGEKRSLMREALIMALSRMSDKLTITEAVNIVVAQRIS